LFPKKRNLEINRYLETLFWLVEDWTSSVKLLQVGKVAPRYQFPHKLQMKSTDLHKLISGKYVALLEKDVNVGAVVHVELTLN
jgi:hypothetical protein